MTKLFKIDKKGKLKHHQCVSSTLTGGAHSGGNHSDMDLFIIQKDGGTSIRRLTPVEWERLQAFPDNWTNGVSNTQRYKCLGNAVTTNVITCIIDRLYDGY